MLVLRWNQRAHYWFWGRPKGHISRGPKGHSGKGQARTLITRMEVKTEQTFFSIVKCASFHLGFFPMSFFSTKRVFALGFFL